MLEVLVVLAIVAVLTAIGVPAYQRMSAQHDVNATIRLFAQQAESARLMAQSYGVVVKVCPVSSNDFSASAPDCAKLNADQLWQAWVWRYDGDNGKVIFRGQVPATVGLSTNGLNSPAFDGSGRTMGKAQTVIAKLLRSDTGAADAKVVFSNQGKMTVTQP